MRSTSILTAAALTASGIVLSAGAASAQTAPNPDLRSFATGPACAAKTLTGSLRTTVVASTLPKGSIPKAVVQLRWNAGGTAYTDSSVLSSQTFNLTAGTSDYSFSLDASQLPATAKNVMAYALGYTTSTSQAPVDTLQSKVLAASFCGAASASNTTVSSVSIDCSGDLVNGAAALADPPSSSIPGQVALQGRAAGASTWTTLASKAVTVAPGTTSLPYDFSIAGKHTGEYRAFGRVNNGTIKYSDVVTDATCAPPAEVPEAPAALLLPLTMAAGAGAVVVVRRRRTATTPALSA